MDENLIERYNNVFYGLKELVEEIDITIKAFKKFYIKNDAIKTMALETLEDIDHTCRQSVVDLCLLYNPNDSATILAIKIVGDEEYTKGLEAYEKIFKHSSDAVARIRKILYNYR